MKIKFSWTLYAGLLLLLAASMGTSNAMDSDEDLCENPQRLRKTRAVPPPLQILPLQIDPCRSSVEYGFMKRELSAGLAWLQLCESGEAEVYYAWEQTMNVGFRADQVVEDRMCRAAKGDKESEIKRQRTVAEFWLKSTPRENGDWTDWSGIYAPPYFASERTKKTLRVLAQGRAARLALINYIALKTSNPERYSPRLTCVEMDGCAWEVNCGVPDVPQDVNRRARPHSRGGSLRRTRKKSM